MDNKILKQLKELNQHLREMRSLGEADRKFVEQLQEDIEELLQRSEQAGRGSHDGLIRQLEDATGRFEVSHPELTAVLARVINSLSSMGI